MICPSFCARIVSRVCCGLVLWGLLAATARSADPRVLYLHDGDYVQGELSPQGDASQLRWQSPHFQHPLIFPLSSIRSITSLQAQSIKAEGELGLELQNRDWLPGTLTRWGDGTIDFESPRFGRLTWPLDSVQSLYRLSGDVGANYAGPRGMEGFQIVRGDKNGWQADGTSVTTAEAGTAIFLDANLPPRASIELELSWRTKPDFLIAIGTPNDDKALKHAFRLEIWDGDIVVVRETDREADLAQLAPATAGEGRLTLQLLLDQTAGQLQVYSAAGQKLAEIQAVGRKATPQTGIRFENRRGDLRLDRLRVSPWLGSPVGAVNAGQVGILVAGPGWKYAPQQHLHIENGQATLTTDNASESWPLEKILAIRCPSPTEAPPTAAIVRVNYVDGARMSGALDEIGVDNVWLRRTDHADRLALPWAGIANVAFSKSNEKPLPLDGQVGELQIEGLRLHGVLKDSPAAPTGVALNWHALGTAQAAPLQPHTNGRIVYREPPPPAKVPAAPDANAGAAAPAEPEGLLGGIARAFGLGTVKKRAGKPAVEPSATKMLHLLTGDTIPCEIDAIDERGVVLKTPVASTTFVAHEHIKALELLATPTARLAKNKQERLMTLPRMQRDTPPNFLVRSIHGDYLRGRDLTLAADTLSLEVRLEQRKLPRDLVARIIWLHPEKDKPEAGEQAAPPRRMQAIRSDGNRLTFEPLAYANETISGNSLVLGDCGVAVRDLDVLLMGTAIDTAARELPFHQWRLVQAPDPKVFGEGDAGGRDESALVGKVAPAIELALLNGSPFKLADLRGQIVVLDFWASWCGPCIQAMPVVEEVTQEFSGQGVRLIAINLEETTERVKAALERMKVNPTVALDRDGKVAAEYGASSIPQTVIIDREGKVLRVFVGAGPGFGDDLRAALKAATAKP